MGVFFRERIESPGTGRKAGFLEKTKGFFRRNGGTVLLIAGLAGLAANGIRLERRNEALLRRYERRASECASTEYGLNVCENGKSEAETEAKKLKGNVLFKGGKATIHFDLLDGSGHTMSADVKGLNGYISEGGLNRHIMEVCKRGCDLGELERFVGRERIRRFFHKGSFSPYLLIKLDNGVIASAPNYLAFADTNSMKELAEYIKANSKDDREFIANVLYVKSQVNTYSHDFTKEARYPLETFLEGGGDCGASSIFVGSVIKAGHPEWIVQFWAMNGLSPENPKDGINHAIVYVNDGKSLELAIETTADDYKRAIEHYKGKRIRAWPFDL